MLGFKIKLLSCTLDCNFPHLKTKKKFFVENFNAVHFFEIFELGNLCIYFIR